jgi:hypothetical protein
MVRQLNAYSANSSELRLRGLDSKLYQTSGQPALVPFQRAGTKNLLADRACPHQPSERGATRIQDERNGGDWGEKDNPVDER